MMILTILWRVNPYEGSVVPRFLTDNLFGIAARWVLFVTSIPVWVLCVSLCDMLLHLPEGREYIALCAAMILIQGVIYFFVGKLVSVVVRVIRNRLRRTI